MTKRILIIEDDTSLFEVYQAMLGSTGFQVESATTGQAGLEAIKSTPPDLIILDIMLPGGMNGFDVLEKVEADETTKAIPVIILTNLDSEEAVAKRIGAKKYFVKANTTKDQVVKAVMEYLK
jgi:DNA-binding response OmpR family regulator